MTARGMVARTPIAISAIVVGTPKRSPNALVRASRVTSIFGVVIVTEIVTSAIRKRLI